MNQRNMGVWLIPFLAALAVYLPQTSGTRSPALPPGQTILATQSKPSPLTTTEVAGESLLRRFFGAKTADESRDFQSKYEVQFLIATVPDPLDSGLRYIFDRHVAAIQRAAEAAGFNLERSELPWPRGKEAAEKQGKANEFTITDLGVGAAKAQVRILEKPQSREEPEPGVILFKDTRRDPGRLLLVYLVGETPTAGIDKVAFKRAMEAICSLRKDFPCKFESGIYKQRDIAHYKLLGPTFTGSVRSLKISIDAWKKDGEPKSTFEIISGSATAIDPSQLSSDYMKFNATVMRDGDALTSFLCDLKNKGIGPDLRKVAILSEGSTGYGQAVRPNVRPKEPEKPEKTETPKEPEKLTVKKCDQEKVLHITYPLHISQLRDAAEKARASQGQSDRAAPSLRPHNLRLSLEEDDEAKDIVQPYSSFDTYSVELILSNLLTTISKERIQYVGIFSTDIRDQIFLTRELRAHAPNVTLFTVGADLIYLHSDVNLDFRGTLVISTYPLFSLNQIWTFPFKGNIKRVQFPDHTAQGVYNAALALLGRSDEMVEYGLPLGEGDNASRARKPPIWLSVVGTDNIWPLKIFLQEATESYLYSANLPTADSRVKNFDWHGFYSIRLVYIFVLLSFATMIVSLFFIIAFLQSWVPTWISRMSGWLEGIPNRFFRVSVESIFSYFRSAKEFDLFVFSVGVLTISWIVLRLLMRLAIPPPMSHCPAGIFNYVLKSDVLKASPWLLPLLATLALGMLTSLIATVMTGINLSLSARRFFRQEARFSWSVAIFSALPTTAPLLIFVLASAYAYDICRAEPSTQFFLSLRMLNPGSGLSPLLPLLFVGVTGLLWVFCSPALLRRIEEVNGMKCRFLNFNVGSFSGLNALELKVMNVLTCPYWKLPLTLPATLSILVPSIHLFWFRLVVSFEESGFYRFFGATFIIVYLLLALAFLRFLWAWWFTRRLLQHLSWHPLLNAFKRLPHEWPAMPHIAIGGTFIPFTGLEFSVDRASRLVHLAKEVGAQFWQHVSSLENYVPNAEKALNQALEVEAQGKWREALLLRLAANDALSGASSIIAQTLDSQWRLVAAGVSWTPDNKKEKEWIQQAEHFLVARAVAFLSHVFSQLQSLIYLVIGGLILMLMAVTHYPLEPKDHLLTFNWLAIFSVVSIFMVVFVQMGRNRVLSLLSNTTPGAVSWNREFITQILIYVVLPIFALLGAQFPEGLRQAVSWVTSFQGSH